MQTQTDFEKAQIATASRVVNAALLLEDLSTHFRVELEPAQAREFMARTEPYNNHTTADLLRIVNRINELVPPMNYPPNPYPNPNNGRPHHKFYVGNEGSRVIYLIIYKGYMKGFDYKRLALQLDSLAESSHADEFNVTQDDANYFEYRIWFD